MKRVFIIIMTLLVIMPLLLLTWLTTSESGLLFTYQQITTILPAELTVGKIEGRLFGPITIKDLRYKQPGTLISSEQLILDWQPSSLLLAHIDISQLHIQSLSITLDNTEINPQTTSQPITLPDINLPWRLVVNNFQIDKLSLHQQQQSHTLTQLSLSATSLFSHIDIKELRVVDDRFSVNINGDLFVSGAYRHDLNINWQSTLPNSEVIKGQGNVKGNVKTTRIRQQLSGAVQLDLNAQVNELLDQVHWQTAIEVHAFNTAQMLIDGPELSGQAKLQAKGNLDTATVTGSINGKYADIGPFDALFDIQRLQDNSLQIDRLMLHSPVSDTRIDAHGQWRPGNQGGDMKLALQWQNLRWPLQGKALFNTASGEGKIEGNIDQYHLDISTDRPWPQAPPSTWHARASGNLDGLKMESLRVTALNGETLARGQINWSPQLSWNASITASHIDPASLWPQWPGKIDAKLISRGRIEKDQLIADTDISELTGQLRGHPLSMSSHLSWNNNGLDIKQFDFQSGTSTVTVKGRVAEKVKLDWRITASNMAELYPHAQGQLNASGHFDGPMTAPLVQASLTAQALSLPGYQIGNIKADISVDLNQWQQIDIQLAAQNLSINDIRLDSVDIKADSQQLQANFIAPAASADITLKGGIDSMGWRGQIERADINSSRFQNWQLKKPTALTISQHALLMGALCWHNQQQAQLCSSIERQQNNWLADIEMTQLPLLLSGPWLPPDLKLEGAVSATAKLKFSLPDQLLGEAHFQLSPGVISYPLLEGERERWEYKGGTASVEMNEQGVTATSDITMSNGDKLFLSAELPAAQILKLEPQQNIRGEAQLTIHDLGLIEAFLPEVQDLNGEVEVMASARGTLNQPRFSGQAHLLKGEFRVPRLGLNIKDISLKANSDGFEKVNLQLNAHSGDGKLELNGQTTLNKEAGWPTSIAIKGEQFEVSKIPEARVSISPDLQIKLQHQQINISGQVGIPYAKLQPRDITTAAKVSEDAVITGGELAVEQKWAVTTKVRVNLGERVNFYGFGFEGRFGGSLLVEDIPGQLTRATGEINVPEGRYRAYGQRLDIEHGRLIYTGSPLSNPGLDLRAVRRVNNVTAGLKVKGSLTHPQLELFTIPTMGQTDALAYLILGRPMESASGEEGAMMAKAALALSLSGGDYLARTLGDRFGLDEMRVESSDSGDQASLVVGRYLSPKIYVSYGVGLIEAINTFTVRYQISDKWQIKAESGEAQGADIFYTFER